MAGNSQQRPPYDPVYLHARREGLVILAVWFSCLLWAVIVAWLWGYRRPVAEIGTVWGIPDWAFYAVVMPWAVVDVFTLWFCFAFMRDDDLGEAHEGLDVGEQSAAQAGQPRDPSDA